MKFYKFWSYVKGKKIYNKNLNEFWILSYLSPYLEVIFGFGHGYVEVGEWDEIKKLIID